MNVLLTATSNLMSCIESPETHSCAVVNNIIIDQITCSSSSTCIQILAPHLRTANIMHQVDIHVSVITQ